MSIFPSFFFSSERIHQNDRNNTIKKKGKRKEKKITFLKHFFTSLFCLIFLSFFSLIFFSLIFSQNVFSFFLPGTLLRFAHNESSPNYWPHLTSTVTLHTQQEYPPPDSIFQIPSLCTTSENLQY